MYRSIDADTWSDPWFSELPPPAKLVFLYLITNHHVNAAGLCEVTMRVMSFETGLERDQIERLLPKLAPRVMWWPDHNLLWVRNFYKRQRANTNSVNFRTAAARITQDAPPEVQATIIAQYPDLGEPAPPPPKKPKETKDTDASRQSDHASSDGNHASASHTNGIAKPSPSHANTIRNRTEPVPEPGAVAEETDANASAPPKRRAPLHAEQFMALADACHYDTGNLTKDARGRLNDAAAQLDAVGASGADIAAAADALVREWGRGKLSPNSLAVNWPRFARAPANVVNIRPVEKTPVELAWDAASPEEQAIGWQKFIAKYRAEHDDEEVRA